MTGQSQIDEILDYWFGDPNDPEYGKLREFWFRGGPKADDEIRARFLADYEAAVAGHYEEFESSPRGILALILLLDQFPRNMFRGKAHAFATDDKALALAKHAIDAGLESHLRGWERVFLYLPFEHAEDIAEQRRSLALFEKLDDFEDAEQSLEHARRHLEVIERFGRFPHRNAVLGRDTTPEEAEFLKEPNSSFDG